MSFVYVVLADNDDVKVGWSSTPYARLSKIKRDYGQRRGFTSARLLAFVETPSFLDTELLAHHALREHWLEGEWFHVPAEAALDAVIEAAWLLEPTGRPVCVHRPFDRAAA